MTGRRCGHEPRCPSAAATDGATARTVTAQESQGWAVLCNGLIVFDDGGCVLPGGRAGDALRVLPRAGAAA
ncbi:DUF5999 family protein [Streptomyces sp. NPDC059816]|uniref:DUF5999 family protein n=1 Tax=Streptomyces sp. NPDC059816 TaxID=3346960 RepID=UPI00364998E5